MRRDVSRILNPVKGFQSSSQVLRGVVLTAPATDADSMTVGIRRFAVDAEYEVPAGNWTPRGLTLPTVGQTVVVLIDDFGDAHVPLFDGANDFGEAFAFFNA